MGFAQADEHRAVAGQAQARSKEAKGHNRSDALVGFPVQHALDRKVITLGPISTI